MSRAGERVEWRAGADDGDPDYPPYYGDWGGRADAEDEARRLLASDPPCEDVWLERRNVVVSEPERVPFASGRTQREEER